MALPVLYTAVISALFVATEVILLFYMPNVATKYQSMFFVLMFFLLYLGVLYPIMRVILLLVTLFAIVLTATTIAE